MRMLFLPREHGAYGQMSLPLVTSFLVAGMTTPAALVAVAVVAGFLAHEPLAVLLGRRGVRARREQLRAATVWCVVTGSIAAGTGIAATLLAPASVRWSFLVPLLPGAILMFAILAKREKSAYGEVAVALAFSLVAVPVCLAAGAAAATAWCVGIAFASVFVSGTLAVRAIVLAVRGGGNPSVAHATRIMTLTVGALAVASLAFMGARTLLPWATLIAAVPGLAVATWLTLFPPLPNRLRSVGWTLVATSVFTALVLVAGLATR